MEKHHAQIRIGTAGWPLPAAEREFFPPGASLLERYSRRFNAVEINSSFYRSHRTETYRRWAETVPEDFAFSAKLPREITHVRKLVGVGPLLEAFAAEVSALGPKLKAVLIQLPPSLRFELSAAEKFLQLAQCCLSARLLCEPRHATWFTDEASDTLIAYGVSRVAADPAPAPAAHTPGGANHTAYFRLHGSPRMYYSPYDTEALRSYAESLHDACSKAEEVWCIFDNTAEFHATRNARELSDMLDNGPVKSRQEPRSSL